jgi:hypothetical protein
MIQLSKVILEELKSGPVKWIASFFSIILAIIVLSQYIGPHNLPPLVDNLTPDKPSPQNAGETITWTAKAVDYEDDMIQYKFFLNGDSVTEWSPQNFWVCIRDSKHASKDSYDSCKISDFIILDINQAPIIGSLVPNLPSPQEAGINVIWTALASDFDGDIGQYKFFLDGQPKTDWSDDPTWVWTTSNSNIGAHVIEVKVKDNKHNPDGDDSKANDFSIVAPLNPLPIAEILTTNKSEAEVTSQATQITDYLRTNEYKEDSLSPSCTPESKQATCSSPDSCVDCDGICWLPRTYNDGKTVCSQGKWTIKDSSPGQISSYPRTNEYKEDSLSPSCIPGSKQATCPSPDSCVDCDGICWLPRTYNDGKTVCSQGKWTISF